jgi:hypothetical protein
MAVRPVFLPTRASLPLVQEILIEFTWHAGFAPSQKKKNVRALHKQARERGLGPLLEISSKSEAQIGVKLSAFHLKTWVGPHETSVECIYQGSKVFERGGPYTDLYLVPSRDAKKDWRLRESGALVGFHFEDTDYPLSPPTAFYDWVYINALFSHRQEFSEIYSYKGFTDIEFNPDRSLNCQARSCATFVALVQRGLLEEAIESFDTFVRIITFGNERQQLYSLPQHVI